ncbi:MAG: LysR family transcriptional regulator [Candidatus Rokubacteria bacterium]|nr:LysR family transcriptional regulator [Candidatus Rokubacteria bacterium]MBI3029774.1 LysR family transcriptional regulator [Candidatus Rokubacteria bacterium]
MARRLRVRSKVWVEADGRLIFSDGRLALLEAVAELGSLRRAAQRLEISYRAAWGLLKVTEAALGVRLLEVTIGGSGGGGATLTPAAFDLVARYRRVKVRVNRTADRAFARAFGGSFLGHRYV